MTLNANQVKTISRAGRYGDGRGGHGLSLLVKARADGSLSKTWAQRIRIDGKPRNLGLGTYPVVSLATARSKALKHLVAVDAGEDPTIKVAPPQLTVRESLEGMLRVRAPHWGPQSRSESIWRSSFRDYVFPTIGSREIRTITVPDVLDIIEPIWASKPETAKRVLQRLALVFEWAMARGFADSNPTHSATSVLPKIRAPRVHRKAMDHADVGEIIKAARTAPAAPTMRLCFEFTILTAARSGEARGATWTEIDMERETWSVPAERMKLKRAHRVPLSSQAMEVLRRASEFRTPKTDLVFPSNIKQRKISDAGLLNLLKKTLNRAFTIHGFRSSFRDWCAESDQPYDAAEASLAHVPRSTEAAYFRSDLLEKRRAVMQAWADYVVPISQPAS